jgi:hypothetical protein
MLDITNGAEEMAIPAIISSLLLSNIVIRSHFEVRRSFDIFVDLFGPAIAAYADWYWLDHGSLQNEH